MAKPNYGIMVNADKMYPISYAIRQDGRKAYKKTFSKGSDLTENQIRDIVVNEISGQKIM